MEVILAIYLTSVFYNFISIYTISGACGEAWYKSLYYWVFILSGLLGVLLNLFFTNLLEKHGELGDVFTGIGNDIDNNFKKDEEEL